MRVVFRLAYLGAALLLIATPVTAEVVPGPETLATPEEIAVVSEAYSAVAAGSITGEAGLARLDAMLTRLPSTSRGRGLIQMLRAGLLQQLKRERDAVLATEESIRLLPGYSGPLLLAVGQHAYSDRPQLAADYLLRASRIDPDKLQAIPSYEVNNLLGRLKMAGDEQRIAAVSERLVEIGWRSDDLDSRSRLVRNLIERKLKSGEVAKARALVTELLNPSDMYRLLATKEASSIWPNVEDWAGRRLEKQWPVYLREARERWDASQSLDAARDYLQALSMAGHDETIARELLPLFSRPASKEESEPMLWFAARVASALGRLGRWDEIDAMYESLEKLWPLGSNTNALNLSANRARHLLYAGKPDAALKLMDASIADAEKNRKEISAEPIIAMHQARTCMLHAAGRAEEASRSAAIGSVGSLASPTGPAGMYLCLGRFDDARRVIIEGLENSFTRTDVIVTLQPTGERPLKSPYGLAMAEQWRALRSDQQVLAALKKHGRVLPFTLSQGAPAQVVRTLP